MSKSRFFHNRGETYIDDHSQNELVQALLTGGHILNRDQTMHVHDQSHSCLIMSADLIT